MKYSFQYSRLVFMTNNNGLIKYDIRFGKLSRGLARLPKYAEQKHMA